MPEHITITCMYVYIYIYISNKTYNLCVRKQTIIYDNNYALIYNNVSTRWPVGLPACLAGLSCQLACQLGCQAAGWLAGWEAGWLASWRAWGCRRACVCALARAGKAEKEPEFQTLSSFNEGIGSASLWGNHLSNTACLTHILFTTCT